MHNLFMRNGDLIYFLKYCVVLPVLTLVVGFSLIYFILYVIIEAWNMMKSSKQDNLNWCCKIGNEYNIMPGTSWGTLDAKSPLKTEWSKRFCDNIIGGGGRNNCQK